MPFGSVRDAPTPRVSASLRPTAALLVRLRDPDFFDYDRKFLRSLGTVRSTEELELYAEVLRENAPLRTGFLREKLHLRISTRRLSRLGDELLA